MTTDEKSASARVECQCGEWSGEPCEWAGERSNTAIVEWMPAHLRHSHVDARNRGSYPSNGASRIRVARSCADFMIRLDGDWCAIIEGK